MSQVCWGIPFVLEKIGEERWDKVDDPQQNQDSKMEAHG
jgi:hypothetical protein